MNDLDPQANKLHVPPVTLSSVGDVRLIELPRHTRENGEIVVAQAAAHVPFAIARMFTLTAPLGAQRGDHAHRRCTQFLLCVHGAVEVVCDDGRDQRSFVLDRSNLALCVPPTIWNTVIFKKDRSVAVILCDRPFEEPDYLRTYPEFLDLRKTRIS
jgi:dTDP-4-dehydrorhamnose 3,5-epimerase-like enzyme